MNWENIQGIFKWVFLVFLAGFIGYFGKYLGQRLISRFSKKKAHKDELLPTDKRKAAIPPPMSNEKTLQKIEKKRLKQQQKASKKKS